MQNTTKINLTTSKKYKPNKPLDQNTKTTTTHNPTQNYHHPPPIQIKSARGEKSEPTTRSEPTNNLQTQHHPKSTQHHCPKPLPIITSSKHQTCKTIIPLIKQNPIPKIKHKQPNQERDSALSDGWSSAKAEAGDLARSASRRWSSMLGKIGHGQRSLLAKISRERERERERENKYNKIMTREGKRKKKLNSFSICVSTIPN